MFMIWLSVERKTGESKTVFKAITFPCGSTILTKFVKSQSARVKSLPTLTIYSARRSLFHLPANTSNLKAKIKVIKCLTL